MLESVLQLMTTLMGFLFALYIVMQPHPVLATYALIALALTTAIKWWIYKAGFFSLILLLIYMGAVLVFFLFVVMTLSQDIKGLSIKVSRKIFSVYAGFSVISIIYYLQKLYKVGGSNQYLSVNSAQGLSQIVLQDSTMLLQWIGLFLLLVMLVAILLLIKLSAIEKD